jgi:tetratricopeptide (TPR) repeat protein
VAIVATAACVGAGPKPDPILAPQAFYTVMGEIALTRHEPRVAALQYQAAAEGALDPALLQRATQVATDTLQPSIAAAVSARWIGVDPKSVDAHHAAARAALALFKINDSAEQYRIVLQTSPDGTDAAFARLETELASADNAFGSRQIADKLAEEFPSSAAARQMQGFAQLRADDPAAAVRSFTAAMALKPEAGVSGAAGAPSEAGAAAAQPDAAAAADAAAQADAQRELAQALARARISAGDVESPLAEFQAKLEHDGTPADRLDYALLLLSAQRDDVALEQLAILARTPEAAPVALRLLGIVEYQQGKFDAAGMRFTELLRTGKFLDDAFYYLGLIAEKHNDPERALRLYAQVQSGDYFVSTLLRAATILQTHGDAPAADQLLDRLVEDTPEQAPEIFAARARIYADAGDIERGLKVLDWGVLQYPDNVDMHYALAATYEQAGRIADALRELSALLKDRPDDPAALNALGYTLADHHKHLSQARGLIERAHAAAPKNAAILDSMGWVRFRQGKTEQALPYLSEAYADDRGGDIAAHLGEVQWTLGHQAEADRIWSASAIVDPDNRLLKSTRQRMHALK